ncbi:MAG: ATP-binding protein [Hyphomonadaceae bacterium JAD_PAG50586_4]|nr:MAG: ATP-binding protein [Hyphomonadaceae bacterium JAD_PAG50586_4]
MAESPGADSNKTTLRAEFILVAAIAVVSVLVVVLGSLLLSGARLNTNEYEVVAMVRAVRAEIAGAARGQSDAETLASRYVATRNRALLADYERAKDVARDRVRNAQILAAGDSEVSASLTELENLIERRLNILDAEVAARPGAAVLDQPHEDIYTRFREQSDALQVTLNGRIDVSRVAEDRAHQRLDFITMLLGALSLATSGLAIFALRRERQQWRLAHQATEDARAKAHESDLAKTRFLAVASHDMRQPLHALTLYLSALERRVEGAEARDILQKMDRATQSMVGMFAMLLDLARVQAGVVQPEIVDVPLQEVFDRVIAEHPGGNVDAAPTQAIVRTDPNLLERVLANLVANAMKHGGGKAHIEARAFASFVEVDVADDGPGIPIEDQERVFEEFVRLDGRAGAEGLGLGLAIVRRIAGLLNVPIRLVSAPGRGARFILRMPLVAANGGAAARSAKHGEVTLAGANIIVIDDDPLAREAIAGALRDVGAEVRAGSNEPDLSALLAQGATPDLLVMDLRIDGQLQGIDIANRARAKLASPPRVIVVTGDTGPETLAMLRAAGYAWLIKPVDAQSLSEAAAAQVHAA